MIFSRNRRLICISVLLILCNLSLMSCAARMMAPKSGATGKFYKKSGDEYIAVNKYDFSRLKRGYGLYIFSYDITGPRGNRISGYKTEQKQGIRILEYKFKDSDPEIIRRNERFMFWGYNSLQYLLLFKKGYDTDICATYHRGGIVYGGRFYFDFTDHKIQSAFGANAAEEDLELFLEDYNNNIEGMTIDTVRMKCD